MQDIYQQMKSEGLVHELIHGNPGIEAISDMVRRFKKSGSAIIFDDG